MSFILKVNLLNFLERSNDRRNVKKCELDSTRTAPCWLKALGSPRAFCRACRANIRLSVSSSLWQIRRQHHSQMFIDPLILTDRLCVHLPDLF